MTPRRLALALAVVAPPALTLAAVAVSYRAGHDAGRIEGRAAAYRETDQVLRDLERALAPIAAGRHAAASSTPPSGDAP